MPLAVTIKDIHDTAENTKTFIFDLKNLGSKPGQFVNIWIPDVDEKPYSIAEDNNEELWLTVCKVGPFSSKLFTMKKGDKVGVRGPFGKGFTIFEDKTVVLVGGGFGMAPLHFLGKKLQQNGSKVFAAIGARNKKFLVFEDKCLGSGFETCVATDDGSAGHQGFSTELLRKILTENKIDAVQTCGPELMMKKVAEICQKNSIKCELSIERYMKCGFGVCGQCDCGGKRMCVDGPVVDGNWALRQEDFGVYHRGPEGQKQYF